MTNPAQEQNTNVTDMADFASKYGDEAFASLDTPDSDNAESRAQTPPEDSPASESDLDSATLEALGLVEPDQDQPGSDSDTDEGSGTEDSQIDLGSLASTLGLDADSLVLDQGALKLRTKVDGEENAVSLEELRKGYQLQSHFTRQNEAFLQQRQAWEQARQAQEAQLTQQAQLASEVLASEEQSLRQAYTKDWEKLRQEDPAEYAAQVAEYNQKLSNVRGKQQNLVQTIQQRQMEQNQRMNQAMQQQRMQGIQALSETLGWKDEETYQKGAGQIREYLLKNQVQPQEIDNILDSRTLVMADKARRYDDLMSRVDTARKKVGRPDVPHKVPQGTATRPKGGKARRMQDSMNRLKSENSVEAAADVFKQMGLV